MRNLIEKQPKLITTLTCKFCKEEFSACRTNMKFCSSNCRKRHFTYTKVLSALMSKAKYRAKKDGIEFTISIKDLGQSPERCPILDIPLFKEFKSKRGNPNSPSIDRIDSNKGYVPGNVHIISWRANCLKNNGSVEEFEKLVNWMKNNDKNIN